MRPAAALITLALAAAPLTACGSDSSTTPTTTTTTPTVATPASAKVCPKGGTFETGSLIGKSEQEATVLLKGSGCTLRVTERDGQPGAVTTDYDPTRVNVTVEDGAVTRIVGLG